MMFFIPFLIGAAAGVLGLKKKDKIIDGWNKLKSNSRPRSWDFVPAVTTTSRPTSPPCAASSATGFSSSFH